MKKFIITTLFINVLISVVAHAEIEKPTILYIGDSHSYGNLGIALEEYLTSISKRTIMMASCGSSAKTWLGLSGNQKTVCGFWKKDGKEEVRTKEFNNPKLADELAKNKPSLTIVQLGTNLAVEKNPLIHAESVRKVMELISSKQSSCLWIGPPDANSKVVTRDNLKIVNIMLRSLAEENNCSYIDSLELTQFPETSKEGIHYPSTLYKKWAENIVLKLFEYNIR